tara:strand:- start:189 stop:968 length:780 start_codon:yes stop_codon:yes gene_type:complete
MITCQLKGGLGNMMSQIAFVEYQAHKYGLEPGYWNIDAALNHLNNESHNRPNLKHAREYLTIFENFKWPRIKSRPSETMKVPFWYEDITIKNNVNYDGYFQSEKYYPDRSFVLNLFQPSNFVKLHLRRYQNLLEGSTCSIHVRRGDFLKYDLHKVRDKEFYERCMDEVGEVDKYLVFSDDIAWCRENFIGDKFVFIEHEKDYIELFVQSKCDDNIISSSSFSWWAAYLNTNEHKKVVGPKQWFSVEKRNDIIPEGWITI